jgi:hypothetical protein
VEAGMGGVGRCCNMVMIGGLPVVAIIVLYRGRMYVTEQQE